METYQVVLGLIVSMAIIVGIYYLLKILIAYVGHTLLWGIGVGFAFLVICNYIAPDYMIEVGLVGATIGAVFGLVRAILRTKDIVKTDFAKSIVKEMTKTDPNGTTYIARDQYGNTTKVKKTGNDILGGSYYVDSEGNSYERDYGSNELK